MTDPTIQDVEKLAKNKWTNLPDDTKQALLDDAIREAETIYSGKVSTTPILDGDRVVFIKNLAAHKWEMAEGGEATSESGTGGSVSYNTVTGDAVDNLQQTRFGREALSHVRDSQSTGVVRSWF